MTDADLAAAIAGAALLRGTFTLRSGRTSSYYLDKYRFETVPAILDELGDRFAARVKAIEADGGAVDRLAGAELGGIPLVTVAAVKARKPTVLIRNQKKDYGTAKRIEGALEPGDRVVIVEDVATTGGQVIEAATLLRDELGAEVVAIIAVVDRQEGARENVERAGFRFDALLTKADLGIDE